MKNNLFIFMMRFVNVEMRELAQRIKHLIEISKQIHVIEHELKKFEKITYIDLSMNTQYCRLKEQWAMSKRLQRVSFIIQLVEEKKKQN